MPTETVDVTPTFNYQRHVEVLKRFAEKLLWYSNMVELNDPHMARSDDRYQTPEDELADFVAKAMPFVKVAISELLADDILVQIKTNIFPLGPQIMPQWHAYKPYNALDNSICDECGDNADAIQHVFA